jgi:hypothetical protein
MNGGGADSKELLDAVNSVSGNIGVTSSGSSTTLVNEDVQICGRTGELALAVCLKRRSSVGYIGDKFGDESMCSD